MNATDKDAWNKEAQHLRQLAYEICRRVEPAAAALQESPPRAILPVADLIQITEHCNTLAKMADWMEAAT